LSEAALLYGGTKCHQRNDTEVQPWFSVWRHGDRELRLVAKLRSAACQPNRRV